MILSFKGINIHYTIEGSGKTVVLLHGFLERLSMWEAITPHLLKNCKVIAIDLLGHGKTPSLGYVHTMEEMAEAVGAVLSKHRIRKPILIGHSMGGYVALAFADLYPDKVKALCLLNSTSREDCKERIEGRETAMRVAKNHYEAVIRISIHSLFRDGDEEEYVPIVKKLVQEALEVPKQGYFAAQEGMKLRPNREHVLKNVGYSKLIISSKYDDLLCLDDQKEEAKRTNTPLVVLSEGHMSHIENESEVIEILSEFVKNA